MLTHFSDPNELALWLQTRGVETADWGTGSSKTIESLWVEFVQGEVSFQEDPVMRLVAIVQIIIQRDQKILIESEQELDDFQRRSRNLPPSEKIKPNEDPLSAAARCIHEELGIDDGQINSLQLVGRPQEKRRDSPSYPGLLTRYVVHTVSANITDLPEGAFWRPNSAAEEGDPVLRHLWTWQPLSLSGLTPE